MFGKLQLKIVPVVKRTFRINNLSLFLRKKRQSLEKLIYHKKFTAKDIIEQLSSMGIKPGAVIIVHCAMNNFYNYRGTVDELIDALIDYLGPTGTLCMPAYPYDKNNPDIVFDVRTDKTEAGLLAETFRKRPGVKRSLNKLHSVCALGPKADFIVGEHQYSLTCFDEKSPFYKIALLGGWTVNLGLPKYFIGTMGHVCESLLRTEIKMFKNKFTKDVTFTYIDNKGNKVYHTMLTKSIVPYIRRKDTKFIDDNFAKDKYYRYRLSNIWIHTFDANYLIEKLSQLARQGITIFKYPKYEK